MQFASTEGRCTGCGEHTRYGRLGSPLAHLCAACRAVPAKVEVYEQNERTMRTALHEMLDPYSTPEPGMPGAMRIDMGRLLGDAAKRRKAERA